MTCRSARCRRVYRGRAAVLVALVEDARGHQGTVVLSTTVPYGQRRDLGNESGESLGAGDLQ